MLFKFPSWLSWYKKPEYRDIKEYSTNISTGKRPLSPDGRNGGIPSRLRLERILANKTCELPPSGVAPRGGVSQTDAVV